MSSATPWQNLAPRGRMPPLFFRCFTTRTGRKKRTTSYSTNPDQKYHDATDVMIRACPGSKGFCIWTHIELLRPSRTMLLMQIPVAVSDHIRVQQAVRPLLLSDIRNLAKDLIALDATVDDDVSDVNAAWS